MTEKKDTTKEKKEAKKQESYKYSVKLSSGDASKSPINTKAKIIDVADENIAPPPKTTATPPTGSVPTPNTSQQLQQSLEALKQNPEAMKAFQQLIKSEQPQKESTTVTQKLVTVASKFTASNIQKSASTSLKLIDSFVRFIVKKEGEEGEEGEGRNEVVQKARSPILFGMWVAIVVFFIGGLWSGLAPLDKASHAQGFVVPDSKKQILQHREGGILEELYVKEGEEVEAGQLLAKLSDKAIKASLEGLRAQKNSSEKLLEINREQLSALEELYQKGFASKVPLIETQSKEAQNIAHISDIEARILEQEERLERLSIVSPLTGVVNQIQIHTKGGTVQQGATLMTVTPADDTLVIEAFVSPDDIDSVHIGLKSKVRISAFRHRSTGYLDGTVSFVSSDIYELPQGNPQEATAMQRDPKGLKYKVRVEIDKEQLKKISKYRSYELYPGMTADVTIVTGERTLLQYLLDPVTSTFWHAFKET